MLLQITSPWRCVLGAGALAGTLDIVFATSFWQLRAGVPAPAVLQSIAAGLLGRASFAGGLKTAALGLLLHYAIAIAMSVAYFAIAGSLTPVAERPLAAGTVYGLALYVVMTQVVVPLSAAPRSAPDPLWIGLSVVAHVALVGIPIAYGTRYALAARPESLLF